MAFSEAGRRCEPPPPAVRRPHPVLDALEAGEPVVVRTWDASARRGMRTGGWSCPVFIFSWDVPGFRSADRRNVPYAVVSPDDIVRPVCGTQRG